MVDIIDLYLLEHSKELKMPVFLDEAIETNSLVVVLGSPGSGKTSILEKYFDTNEEAQFLKIKKFIKLDNQVNTDTTVLLLDGLDEYRSVSTDKTFVIEELANKLKALNDIKIVISCREMDWYGESDKSALKDVLDSDAVVFSVQLLNLVQQIELATIYGIDNPQSFIDKFSPYGFLDNPQMFKMIAELYKEKSEIDFSSKAELYEEFIRGAKEKNEENKQNLKQLTSDEILKYSGYLAFFYMFTDVESFENDFVDYICDNDKGFSKEKLTKVLNTSLFDHKIFMHRTIAEFALAHFLVNEKMKREDSLNNERIKALFLKNGKIPTEVRGVYAWLCSLHGNMSFIDADPYYQSIYGDNSLFTEKQKSEIVLSVKRYAKEHPYFIDFWGMHNQLDGLALLYTHNLDDFYIEQLEEAKSMKNHYIFFIVSILNTSNTLSIKMKEYLKKNVFDSDVPAHIKDDILKVFDEELDFLLAVLNSIKDGIIEDNENTIKEFLLKKLYLKVIKPSEIVEYLKLYYKKENNVMGHGLFLYETEYKDKLELVKLLQIMQKEEVDKKDNEDFTFSILDFMENFTSDFLYETILKYPEEMNADTIYNIIYSVREDMEEYTHLGFEPYVLVRKDDRDEHEKVFQQLSDKLYSIHLDNAIKKRDDDEEDSISSAIFDYNYFFSYRPNSEVTLLIEKIKSTDNLTIKKELFSCTLTYLPFGYDKDIGNYDGEIEQLQKISDEYCFTEFLEFRLSKDIPKWKVKREERDEKRKIEIRTTLEKNEKYFSKRTNEEIITTFSDLKYISDLLYFGEKEEVKYLKKETLKRLKQILKVLIYSPSINSELTTIDSLSKLTKRERYIEQVYHVSLSLNKFVDSHESIKINEDLLGYLYINNLKHSNVGNIIKSDFCDYLENSNASNVLKILKEYIGLLINVHNSSLNFIFNKYITNETSIELLIRIANSHESNLGTIQEDLLNNILAGYAFVFDYDDLTTIRSETQNDNKNSTTLNSLLLLLKDNKSDFDIHMAVSLYNLLKHSSYVLFNTGSTEFRVKVIDYMFSVFNTEQSIQSVNGYQSQQSQCASFLTNVVKTLSIKELQALYLSRQTEDNIWRNRILNEIDTKEQQDADQSFDKYSITKIKEFALADTILSKEDFFEDTGIKLNLIKQEIEDNRNNEKNQFYNEDGSSKNEESCRDAILQKLNDKYGYEIESTKEKYEADNRVDINIKYKANNSYEVQVECKKDKNSDLYKGIKNQLIGKYLSSDVEYGIYMIFYFGDKINKEDMLENIEKSTPSDYQEKIKIIYIDLVK